MSRTSPEVLLPRSIAWPRATNARRSRRLYLLEPCPGVDFCRFAPNRLRALLEFTVFCASCNGLLPHHVKNPACWKRRARRAIDRARSFDSQTSVEKLGFLL